MILYALALGAVVVFVYYSTVVEKNINYSWQYEPMVKKTITETVKPECLK